MIYGGDECNVACNSDRAVVDEWRSGGVLHKLAVTDGVGGSLIQERA
jgi:hypothetical protein